MTVLNPIKKSKDIHTVIDIGNNKISCLIGTSMKTNDMSNKGFRLWTTCICRYQ